MVITYLDRLGNENMNVAEYIVTKLVEHKVDTVFGYQGGNITYMIDAISQKDGISYVQTYNEQGAAFAANAYAQVSQKFGVAISSSGPGAINMINGVANAYFDSIPCLFITGNINTAAMKDSDLIRQNGFQEADIVSMVKGITKYATTIMEADAVPEILEHALKLMREGRPGPVLLDIPHNIQRTEVTSAKNIETDTLENDVKAFNASEIWNLVKVAKRPVLLLGNGSRDRESKAYIKALLDKIPMPVVSSLCGKDVLDNQHFCYRGMVGSYGLPYTNKVVQEADFVLVLGSRLDERQRSVGIEDFLGSATVVHVDIDEHELGHVKKNEIQVHALVKDFLREFLKGADASLDYKEWLQLTEEWKNEELPDSCWIYGKKVRDKLIQLLGTDIRDCVVTVDVGNHQMAAAQALYIGENSYYLNSAGLGSMGYALPAAVGASYANEGRKVICIAGDGGMMMNVQELQVIAREQLPVAIVIVNNQGLGMIENYQKLAFEGRLYGARWGYSAPDFKKLAESFGFEYYNAKEINDNAWLEKNQPVIVEIEV